MELDEQARARLRALADADAGELDDAACSRIAQRVSADGPRALRRARRTRTAFQVGGASLAVALSCVAALSWRDRASDARTAGTKADRRQPAANAEAPAVEPACARRAFVAHGEYVGTSGEQRFDLGDLGTVIAARDSAVTLDVSDACRVLVQLRDGRVDVHAADLGGGELRVLTPSGDVVVRGTVFAVAHGAGSLTVDVDEGRVSVARRDAGEGWTVDAGRRLRVAQGGAATSEALPIEQRAQLRAALGLGVPGGASGSREPRNEVAARASRGGQEASVLSAESLVAEADGLWRLGDLERARERYRRAGALGGATAEAAWLTLARRELSAQRPAAARSALETYRVRFPRGKLAGEALGIELRAALQQGDVAAARRIAHSLQRRHPDTPQADAARRWLEGHSLQVQE